MTTSSRPDILVTAKGLASGFPLSGIAASSALMEKAWPGSQGGTYGANAVACAAALATLDVIQDERLVENSAERGAQLKQALQLVADKHEQITDVRGLGLMIGNEFRDADGKPDPVTAAAAQQEAARRGLLLLTCGAWGQVVRFIPALVVNPDEIDEAAGIWADAVSAVADADLIQAGPSLARRAQARGWARRSPAGRGLRGTWDLPAADRAAGGLRDRDQGDRADHTRRHHVVRRHQAVAGPVRSASR